MIHPSVQLPLAAIREVCRGHGVKSLELFGSALREDFRADSDLDFLVEFQCDAAPDFAEIQAIQEELAQLLGRPVDLLERVAVERSRNYIRRRHILSQVEPVYVA